MRTERARLWKYFLPAFFVLFAMRAAMAQVETATLLGTVHDQSAAVVPNATVRAQNVATGLGRQTVTSADGLYHLPDLPIGEYTITATLEGFKTWVRKGVVLEIGQRAQIDVVLEVGAASQQVMVNESAPMLSTTSSSVGQVVNVRAVAQMPLNGRNFWQLVQLTPGASYIPGGQNFREGGSSIRSAVVNVNINGSARIWNGWSLDGVDITEYEQGGTLMSPNVDALQEFKVEGANMSAEYGHTPNVVNATIKSGTDDFHGSVFEFFRNDRLDARNFFFRTPPGTNLQKDQLRRNQFGVTVGGPIMKNNWFFFGDWEGTRLRQGIVFNNVVPSLAMRAGDFREISTPLRNPFSGLPCTTTDSRGCLANNQIPDALISQQAKFFLPFMPEPNLVVGTASRSVITNSLALNVDKADIKVDKQLTPKDHLMTRWSLVDSREQDPNPFPKLGAFPLRSRAQSVALDWVRVISPKWVNDARFGYYRSIFVFGQALAGTNFTSQAGIKGFEESNILPSFPLINLENFAGFRGSGFDNRPKSNRIRTWQYMDNLSYSAGKHDLKLGGQWYHQTHGFIIGGGAEGKFSFRPTFTGNSFGDFLLGTPDSVFRAFFRNLFGNYDDFKHFYVQDNYRVTPNLTLNLGLRWEVNPFFHGIRTATTGFDGRTGKVVLPTNLDLTAQPQSPRLFGLFQDRFLRAGDLGLPDSIRKSDHLDFAPRVGFAWRPGGSNKWVIRGGYGIFYIFADTNMTLQWFKSPPWTEDQTVFNTRSGPPRSWADFFKGALLGAPNPNPGQPCPFGFVANSCDTPDIQSGPLDLRNTYMQQWNFVVQRAVTNNISMEVAYVGNKTTRLQQFIDRNDPPPGPGASVQARRPFPQWGGMGIPEWVGKANYHSFQAKLDTRNWRGLQLLASYTASKCIDTGTTEGGTTTLLLPFNRAVCDFDRPQNFVLSDVYELPVGTGRRFLRSLPGWANHILGGWQISGILTLQSGLPFTPTIIGDRANTGRDGQRPDLLGQPFLPHDVNCWFFTSSNATCRALFPNAVDAFALPPDARTGDRRYGTSGRNILRADGLKQLDFTLGKRFRITESKQLEFRSEFFNIINHPTFNAPSGAINSRNGGQVSSTLNAARQIQFGLKFVF